MTDQPHLTRSALLFGRKFLAGEGGATAIEYGLIATLIALAIVGGATQLGNRTRRSYNCQAQTIRDGSLGGACS